MTPRITSKAIVVLLFVALVWVAASAAQSAGQQSVINITISKTIPAVNYVSRNSTRVDFAGTAYSAKSGGKATVTNKDGRIAIDSQFSKLPQASSFGPVYLTYVLWAITPEGRANNLGEVLTNDNGDAKLYVTTRLQNFGMMVTAEPYFAVTYPSEKVILQNIVLDKTKGAVSTVDASIGMLIRSDYEKANFGPLQDTSASLFTQEAENALRIARWQQAEKYAPEILQKATGSLDQAYAIQKKDKKGAATAARAAVQAAEDARSLAVKRHQEAVVAEQQREAAEKAALAQAQAQAAEAQAKAAAEKQKAEELARQAAEQQKAAADAQAKLAAEKAAMETQRAQEEAQKAAQAKAAADQAIKAQQELRAQLLAQFNRILPTTDTSRGLVVNMGDVLFDTGKSDLRSAAQINLAKLSGIVLSHPGLKLDIEGFTDTTGTAAFNLALSQKRADSVMAFLVNQGLDPRTMTSTGFGESNPVADNATAAGRQQNRRVQIVISGEVIGAKIGASEAGTN